MKLWPGMIFGLIGLNMVVVGITVYAAVSDRSFGVEPDYYRKALAWDEHQEARRRSDALGWTAEFDVPSATGAGSIRVRLADSAGAPIAGARVELRSFASARPGSPVTTPMTETAPGEYTAERAIGRAGFWEFRVEAVRASDRFECDREIRIGP